MSQIDFIENLISAISPSTALKREQHRSALAIIRDHNIATRGFDGGANTKRTKGWRTSSNSGSKEIESSLVNLRNRSRDVYRNDGYVKRGVNALVSNTIGSGIVCQIKPQGSRKIEQLKPLWDSWSYSTGADFDGKRNFYGLQALIKRTVVVSGECVIIRRKVKAEKGKVGLKIQVCEPDIIDHTKNDGNIVQGVEYSNDGQVVAYWMHNRHPGDGKSTTVSRVPAGDVRIVSDPSRPGQVRAEPWTSAILMRAKDLADVQDASIMGQKIQNCFTVFITRPPANVGLPSAAKAPPLADTIGPGLIQETPHGSEIKMAQPASTNGYKDFCQVNLHFIAAGLEVPFEIVTQDFSGVNFSSARMSWMQFFSMIDQWRWGYFIPQVNDVIFDWFLEGTGFSREDFAPMWTPPARPIIDPTSETNALLKQMRAGVKSWSRVQREQGEDPDEVRNEIASDFEKFDEKGIVLDIDARKLSNAGFGNNLFKEPSNADATATE